MFTPEPYGLHVPKGFTLSGSDSAFIKGQVAILRNRLDLADQQSGRRYATLPSGKGTIVITESFGITRVTVRPEPPRQLKSEQEEEFTVPTIYSGRFTKTRWDSEDPDGGVQIQLTQQCRKRFAGYDPNQVQRVPTRVVDKHFNIPLHQTLKPYFEMDNAAHTRFVNSQYEYLRPNWWSGSMASAIQLIRGYGKPPPDGEEDNRYVPLTVTLSGDPVDTKYWVMPYKGKFDEEGDIQYRFFFDNCHGISFDDTNEPWLVHISPRGVYVMPLPIIPDTTRPEFREWCEQVGDDELLHIIDVFGGIPTGESFPEREELEMWLATGLIQRVCDTSEFYAGRFYSSAVGWSFNNRGHSAVNCCQSTSASGMPVGRTFGLTIELGHIPQVPVDELDKRLELFNKFMRQRDIEDPLERKLFLFKILYGSFSDVEWALRRYNVGESHFREERIAWDNKVVTLDLGHKVRLDMIQEGYLYHTNPLRQPQFKIPETIPFPLTGERYCKSIEFETELPTSERPVCNTAVYSYFANDDLKLCFYFFDPRNYTPENESDKPPCAIIGSWTEITYSGGAELAGNWFINDLDERHPIPATVTTTETEHTPVGFGTASWTFFPPAPNSYGVLSRRFIYNTKVVKTVTESATFRNAMIVPWGFRDGVIYASNKSMTSGNRTTTRGSGSVADPYSYIIYTYDFVFAYYNNPMTGNNGNMDIGDISPPPSNHRPITIVGANYDPTTCSDTFDEGDWKGVGDDVTDELYDGTNHGSGSSKIKGVVGQRSSSQSTVVLYDQENKMYFSFRESPDLCNEKPAREEHYHSSPNPETMPPMVMVRHADTNRLGEKFYASVDELGGANSKDMTTNRYWGYTTMVEVGRYNCQFIGVINE